MSHYGLGRGGQQRQHRVWSRCDGRELIEPAPDSNRSESRSMGRVWWEGSRGLRVLAVLIGRCESQSREERDGESPWRRPQPAPQSPASPISPRGPDPGNASTHTKAIQIPSRYMTSILVGCLQVDARPALDLVERQRCQAHSRTRDETDHPLALVYTLQPVIPRADDINPSPKESPKSSDSHEIASELPRVTFITGSPSQAPCLPYPSEYPASNTILHQMSTNQHPEVGLVEVCLTSVR